MEGLRKESRQPVADFASEISSLVLRWVLTAKPRNVKMLVSKRTLDPNHPLTAQLLDCIYQWFGLPDEKLERINWRTAEEIARHYFREASRVEASKAAKKSTFNIKQWIVVDIVKAEEQLYGCWIHTHGMWRFKRPEIQVFGVPYSESQEVAGLMNDLATYIVSGPAIERGHTAECGDYLMKFDFSDDELTNEHFQETCLEVVSLSRSGQELIQPRDRVLATSLYKYHLPFSQIQSIGEVIHMFTVSPIWRRRDFVSKEEFCFLLMPFRAKWSNRIHRIIKHIVERCNSKCIRADNLYGQDVMEDIWWGINSARLIIADITDRNPNVLYELGIAHTVGKDVILLTQKGADIPFDLRMKRHIIYEDNADGYEVLKKELPKAIKSILEGKPR